MVNEHVLTPLREIETSVRLLTSPWPNRMLRYWFEVCYCIVQYVESNWQVWSCCFFLFLIACVYNRNCTPLERIRWELMSLSLTPSCVLAAGLTSVQVRNHFSWPCSVIHCSQISPVIISFIFQSSRSTSRWPDETLRRASAGKCLAIWSLAWWQWVRTCGTFFFLFFSGPQTNWSDSLAFIGERCLFQKGFLEGLKIASRCKQSAVWPKNPVST